jgi:predicted RNA binding protein YcfA (HicA-like mRNA interferase family)
VGSGGPDWKPRHPDKNGQRATLSIPQHREVKPGTLRGIIRIIRAAGMTVEEFLDLL